VNLSKPAPSLRWSFVLAAALLLSTIACGDNDGNTPADLDDPDTSTPVDDASDSGSDADPADSADATEPAPDDEDVVTIGDVSMPDPGPTESRCPVSVLTEEWPLNNRAYEGEPTITRDGDVITAVIDASAGGTQAANDNPFVYVDLDAGGTIRMTDIEALEFTDWHIALKRVQFRINGGDSGPGAMELARVVGIDFDDVRYQDAVEFSTDISFDEDCRPYVDPIGQLYTAIHDVNVDNVTGSESWYQYGDGIHPAPNHVYVLRNLREVTAYKLQITAWESGVYTLRWAPLDLASP